MKKALIVGIDHYEDQSMVGRVRDAIAMHETLSRNEDGLVNFDCLALLSSNARVGHRELLEKIKRFASSSGEALFYFSGKGFIDSSFNGFLVTQDEDRIQIRDILNYMAKMKSTGVTIILDLFWDGPDPGFRPREFSPPVEGMSLLGVCQSGADSSREDESAPFTPLVIDALQGGASDLLGLVTIVSTFAYIDQALGSWEQRPLFSSHLTSMQPLRRCQPRIDVNSLRRLIEFFPDEDSEFALDPSFEPDAEPRSPDNERAFGHLQKLRAAGLVVPVGEEHMYFAAMNGKSCKLTRLGQSYWRLAKKGRI